MQMDAKESVLRVSSSIKRKRDLFTRTELAFNYENNVEDREIATGKDGHFYILCRERIGFELNV